jgi:DNA-binding transcriptional ArsR family regulator
MIHYGYYETYMKKIRKPLMSLPKLAKLTGITRSRLSDIEVRTSYIYEDEVILIAEILNVDPGELSKDLLVWDNNRRRKPPFNRTRNKKVQANEEQMNLNKDKPCKQQAILDFIRNYPHQYPPSIREIGAGVGLSSSATVHHHLVKLEELGYIERKPFSPRCVVIKENL